MQDDASVPSVPPNSLPPTSPAGSVHPSARSALISRSDPSSSTMDARAHAGPSQSQPASSSLGRSEGGSSATEADHTELDRPPLNSATGSWPEPLFEPTGLFIANLPQATPDAILRQALHFHFSRFGVVTSVKVKREKDVRPIAPRKKEGDLWGWIGFQTTEQTTRALHQAQGIRVLGRTLRVERAKAHRVLLLEPRDGVDFILSPTSGWLVRTSRGDLDLRHMLETYGSVQSIEERRNGGGVLFKFNHSDGAAMLRRLENHPDFHANLYNESPAIALSPVIPRPPPHLPTSLPSRPPLPTAPQDASAQLASASVERGRSRYRSVEPRGRSGGAQKQRPPFTPSSSIPHEMSTVSEPLPPFAGPRDAAGAALSAPAPSRVNLSASPAAPALRLVIPDGGSPAPQHGPPRSPARSLGTAASAQLHPLASGPVDSVDFNDERAIFVGGLNKDLVDSLELTNKFRQYGHITDLHLVRDARAAHTSSGFAFITYDSSLSAHRAVEAENGMSFCGQNIRVQLREAKTRLPTHLRRMSPVRGLPEFMESIHPQHRRSTGPTLSAPVPIEPQLPPAPNTGYHFPPTPASGSSGREPVANDQVFLGAPAVPPPAFSRIGHRAAALMRPASLPAESDLHPQSHNLSASNTGHGWYHGNAPFDRNNPHPSFGALNFGPPSGGSDEAGRPAAGPPLSPHAAPWPVPYFTPFPAQAPPFPPGGFFLPFYPLSSAQMSQGSVVPFPTPSETIASRDGAPFFPPQTPPFHLPPTISQPPPYWAPAGSRLPAWSHAAQPVQPPPRPSAVQSPAHQAGPYQLPPSFEVSPAAPYVRRQQAVVGEPIGLSSGEYPQPSTFPTTTPRPPFERYSSKSH